MYSKRALTKETDKLIAISGIANKIQSVVQILNVQLRIQGSDPFGRADNGFLQIRGPLAKAQTRDLETKESLEQQQVRVWNTSRELEGTTLEDIICSIRRDIATSTDGSWIINSDQELFFLLIWSERDKDKKVARMLAGLALKPIIGEDGQF
jgi:hypothetical protein